MAKKILLIDDSELDIGLVSDILKKNDYEVSSALTVKDGFDKAIQVKPDLILLDLMLPDGSGYDLCKKMKSEASLKDTLIIVLSIKNELADIERAFNSGADDYVVKPPSPEPLLRKIKLYLRDR